MSARSRSFTTLVALAALAGAAAGCGSHEHRDGGTGIDWRPAARRLGEGIELEPDYRRVAIGTVRIEGRARSAAAEAERDGRDDVPIDADGLREALRDLLAGSGAFEEVSLAEEARGETRGLLVEMTVDHALLRRLRRAESRLHSFASWFFLGWIGNWQHTATFEMEVAPAFTILERRTRLPLIAVPPRTGRAREDLSFLERRGDVAGIVATVLWWPQFALDSDPPSVTRALAPASLHGPVREMIAALGDLRMGLRVETPRVRAPDGVRVEVLSPLPDALLANGVCDIEVRVTVRPEAGRPTMLLVGDRMLAASGQRIAVRVRGVEIRPERPLEVKIVLDRGAPLSVAEIGVRREAMPARAPGAS